MRHVHIALLSAALLGGTGALAQDAPPAAADSVAELGRGIFAALQSGSFGDMEHLLPTEADFLEAIEREAEMRGGVPEEQLQEMRRQVPDMAAATREHLAAEFADVREPWREIDWSSAIMTGVRINVRNPETYEERQVDDATLASENIPAAAVEILFKAGDRVREINLQDCLKSSRGWLVMEALSLRQ